MTKQTSLSIIAVFWLLSILCGGVAGFFLYPHVYPCNSNVVDVNVEVTDSIAPNKDTVAKVWDAKPNKVETRKYKNSSGDSKQIQNSIVSIDSAHEGVSNKINICLDTNIYQNDTISVDNFRATSTAYVTNNELVKLQIEWFNLKPEKWKVKSTETTKTAKPEIKEVEKKQSLVKIYTGIYGGVAIQNKTVASYHGGIGLDAIISDRHMIGLQGGLNSALQMEFGVRFGEKIRLKK